ncbi:MarR family transcriptional regulator [Roseibium denhamense]|nr:MarR family transcriptional regulator [Roseibium denhamense]
MLKLSRFLPYQLNHLAETVSRSFSQVYSDRFGIGIPEWRVTATLGEHGQMTARDVGKATSMHKTKVSRAVAGLETKGYLLRTRKDTDQREQALQLTDAGKAMYEEIVPLANAYSNQLQDALSEDQKAQLEDIFARLQAAAENLPGGSGNPA